MPTRRQTLFVMGNLLVVGGILGSGATSVVRSSADASFRVVGGDDDIELTPTNDPPVHVETDDDGFVSAITPGGGDDGLDKRAVTRFEDIVQLTNVGTDVLQGVYFSFEATSSALSRNVLDAVEAALRATAGNRTLESGVSGDNLLTVSSGDAVSDGVLDPGESVRFGLQVNLNPASSPGIEDLPPSDDYELALRIHTEWPDT